MSGDLILYFSRAGENYYEGDLKVVEKGNTEVVADYIKEITNGDVFKVEPEIPYPEDYMECTEVTKNEKNKGKVVKPFVTHEGSGFGKSKKQLKKLCKGADIRNGLEIKGSDVLGSKDKVKCWINDNL